MVKVSGFATDVRDTSCNKGDAVEVAAVVVEVGAAVTVDADNFTAETAAVDGLELETERFEVVELVDEIAAEVAAI